MIKLITTSVRVIFKRKLYRELIFVFCCLTFNVYAQDSLNVSQKDSLKIKVDQLKEELALAESDSINQQEKGLLHRIPSPLL